MWDVFIIIQNTYILKKEACVSMTWHHSACSPYLYIHVILEASLFKIRSPTTTRIGNLHFFNLKTISYVEGPNNGAFVTIINNYIHIDQSSITFSNVQGFIFLFVSVRS